MARERRGWDLEHKPSRAAFWLAICALIGGLVGLVLLLIIRVWWT
jgi:LPS O-antigen subunit length determinant protein (WzzB/FepE family)